MISTALPAEGHDLQCSSAGESKIPYGLNIPGYDTIRLMMIKQFQSIIAYIRLIDHILVIY